MITSLRLILILVIVGVVIYGLYSYNMLPNLDGDSDDQSGGSYYSNYFSPWWRTYFTGPYAGTSSTTYDNLINWPYRSYWRTPLNYYNYWSYWRRPQYYNYWKRPYYYKRPVYRPYVRDSVLGRRSRKRLFNFNPLRN